MVSKIFVYKSLWQAEEEDRRRPFVCHTTEAVRLARTQN